MRASNPIFTIATFLALMALPFLLFGFLSVRIFEDKLLPEVETQTLTAAKGVQRRVDFAIETFGGLHTLRGVEPVLEHARSSAPGISFLAITGPDGAIRHVSADDVEVVSMALEAAVSRDFPMLSGRFRQLWDQYVGIPLSSPVTIAEQRGRDLLVTSLPLGSQSGEPVGTLLAGVDIGTLDTIKRDIWIDTGAVVFAIVLLAIELLLLIFAVYIQRPAWLVNFLTARLQKLDVRFIPRPRGGGVAGRLIKQINEIVTRAATAASSGAAITSILYFPKSGVPKLISDPVVSHIRLPLFLFFISEAILRPILPKFLSDFAPGGNDPDFWTGIIMAGFMAASLFSVLAGSILSERVGGPRRIFMVGALLAGIGMFGHIAADSFAAILLLRMLTGLGYGLVYAAAQVHIAQHADPSRRSSGFSLFLAVVVAAEITGPAVGGILADRLGTEEVLIAATISIALGAMVCIFTLPGRSPDLTDPTALPSSGRRSAGADEFDQRAGILRTQWRMIRRVVANRRFSMATLCFAIPAKALLTGGLFLLVPLTVFSSGGAAESARVLMGYGIAILVLAPLLSPIADRLEGFGIWVSIGGMVAGVGFALPHTWTVLGGEGLTILFVATLIFGLGQTLSIPTQISFLLRLTEREVSEFGAGPVLGVFRFLERLGSFAGPLIAGGLLLFYPPDVALLWMGIGSILMAACGLSWILAVGQQDEEEAIGALLVKA